MKQINAIICAVHGMEEYLPHAINSSLAAPEHPDFENIMLVYTDNCQKAVEAARKELAKRPDKIIVIEAQTKRNQYVGLNTLIRLANRAFCYSVIDADDYTMWHRWTEMLEKIKEHEFIAGTAINVVNNRVQENHKLMKHRNVVMEKFPLPSTWTYRASLIKKMGGYRDAAYSSDTDFLRRARKNNCNEVHTKVLAAGRRIHNKQITHERKYYAEGDLLLAAYEKENAMKIETVVEMNVITNGNSSTLAKVNQSFCEEETLKKIGELKFDPS